jgi:hypothetical protein
MQPENLVNGEFEPMVLRAFDAITRLFSWDEFTHRTGFEDYRLHALRKKLSTALLRRSDSVI